MINSPKLPRKLGALALGVLALWSVLNSGKRPAQADSPPGKPYLDPRLWAQKDYRLADRSEILAAMVRFEILCTKANASQMASGLLLEAANSTTIQGPTATFLSCISGAPEEATCDQIAHCTGKSSAPSDLKQPQCDGGLLRYKQQRARGKEQIVGTSCRAVGQMCYQSKLGGFCGVGTCSTEEPYSCDGDSAVSCVEGIKTITPCGRGMTCGESPGNHAIDCVGKGDLCTGEGRCDGDTLFRCPKDAWGKGREQAISCGDFGLKCLPLKDNDGNDSARCSPPVQTSCKVGEVLDCEGENLRVCINGSPVIVGCKDLNLLGVCNKSDGRAVCK